MMIPKALIINGVVWRIILDDNLTGGFFNWHRQEIHLDKEATDERNFQTLIHEIAESILVNNCNRYQKGLSEVHNGDFLFILDHDQFNIFIDDLTTTLKQFMVVKSGESAIIKKGK